VKRDLEESVEVPPAQWWLPFVWIIVVSAVAHLWCLGSQFYMDDMPQIRDSDVVRSGHFWETKLLAWTYLGYACQYRLFGMSAVGFHVVNWLLHTSVACVLFGFGRDFLKGKWPTGAAFFGALLFAVHPLASEIPNYARTQDLAWVTLFSLLAAWAMLRALRDGRWSLLFLCGLAVTGATFSKGPGLFHALMAVAAVGLASMSQGHWNFLRLRGAWIAGAASVVIAALWMFGMLEGMLRGVSHWSEPRFIGHAYTLCRVFWEFAWRSVIPVGLCSDHHIAETLIPAGAKFWNIPDKGAMLAAAGFLGLTCFSLFLAWRKSTRLFGVCLFLYVATMLFRVLYLIPEFMPEYRIYPGLPWFCLGAAMGLAAIWKRLFLTASPRVAAVILLGVFALLSARRSFVWHNLDRLTADVLRQYPAQARAVWELHDRDAARGDWHAIIARHRATWPKVLAGLDMQEIIDRQRSMWPVVEREFIEQNQLLAPGRELPSGHFVLAMVAIHGRYARAVAHVESPAAGLRMMAQLEAHMKRMKMNPVNKPLEWGYFRHDKGLILEMAGNYEAAAAHMRLGAVTGAKKRDLERVEKKRLENAER
jgi:hypothetical protein